MSDLELGKNGLKSVIAEEHDENSVTPDHMHAEQMSLLPLRNVSQEAGISGRDDTPARGVGRPKGSRNKNTKEWRDYILSHYSSPLIALAETMSRPVQDLAGELGYTNNLKRKATPEELEGLLKIQLSCAKELLPYLHQKQPLAIEAGEGGLMTLNIFAASSEDVKKADDFSLEILEVESEQNQGVSGGSNQKLNALELNASEKTAENSDLQEGKPTD